MTDLYTTRVFWESVTPEMAKENGYPFGAKGTNAKIVVNRGGGDSSKSHSIMQVFIERFLKQEKKRMLIVRKTSPSMRMSIYQQNFLKVLDQYGMSLGDLEKVEKVHMNFYFRGNMIHFGGLDDPDKVKSTEWNYSWLEEATDMSYRDFKIVKLYTRAPSEDQHVNQCFLSFNPIDEYHWLKTELVDNPAYADKKEIVSTYMDNPFCPGDTVQDYKDLEQQDRNYHRIYALGEWGKLENLIYNNYIFVDEDPPTEDWDEIIYGVDFGFNVPSAVLKIWISKDKETAWLKQLIYDKELTNQELIKECKREIPEDFRRYVMYADAAEPQRIAEFCDAGFYCEGSKKGGTSVQNGIEFVKMLNLVIIKPKGDDDLRKEIQSYSWKTDKAERRLDAPVKMRDHLMDAMRGALYTHLGGDFGMARIRYL